MAPYIEGLVEALGAAGARPVLRHGGRDVAGAALLADVHRYARALDGLGIGRGDLVALLAPNSPDALAVRYAAHLLGAGAVYLSVPPNPERRARMIAQFAPRLVVVFPETAELLPRGQRPRRSRRAGAGRLDPARRPRRRRAGHPAAQPRPPRRPRRGDLLRRDDRRAQGQQARPSRATRRWSPPRPRRARQLANGKLAYLTQILVDQTLLGGGTSSSRTSSSPPPPSPRSNGSGSPTCSWSSRSCSRSWTTRACPTTT